MLLLALFANTGFSTAAAAETGEGGKLVRILDLEAVRDPIAPYITEILSLALKKSGKPYVLKKTPSAVMPQQRRLQEMQNNRGELDVIWTMTSDEREAKLLPVRIPIDKGLMGWRIAFVKAGRTAPLQAAKSLGELAALKAGQGQYWPDADILRTNGLPVVIGSANALFGMLEGGRFDYFPRSILEIWNEQSNHRDLPIEIDNAIALHYPAAMYFFVAPKNKNLAEDIRAGLETAIADGSFDAVFNQYCRPFIQKANIKGRQVFELKNPLLNSATLALQRSELWYRP